MLSAARKAPHKKHPPASSRRVSEKKQRGTYEETLITPSDNYIINKGCYFCKSFLKKPITILILGISSKRHSLKRVPFEYSFIRFYLHIKTALHAAVPARLQHSRRCLHLRAVRTAPVRRRGNPSSECRQSSPSYDSRS